MPTLIGNEEDIEFEVWCSKCGAGLCGNAYVKSAQGYRGSQRVYIEPCEKCLENSYDEGVLAGHDEGKSEGYDEGYQDGINKEKD
jgi:hypothetical protein